MFMISGQGGRRDRPGDEGRQLMHGTKRSRPRRAGLPAGDGPGTYRARPADVRDRSGGDGRGREHPMYTSRPAAAARRGPPQPARPRGFRAAPAAAAATAGQGRPPDDRRTAPGGHRRARRHRAAHAGLDLAGKCPGRPGAGHVGRGARRRVVPRPRRQRHRQLGREPVVLPPPAACGRHAGPVGHPAPGPTPAGPVHAAVAHLPAPRRMTSPAGRQLAGEGVWHPRPARGRPACRVRDLGAARRRAHQLRGGRGLDGHQAAEATSTREAESRRRPVQSTPPRSPRPRQRHWSRRSMPVSS